MSVDEKQWLISRLDTTIKAVFDEFQLSKDDFIKIREELVTKIINKRNYILSSVVFVSVLLVAFQQIEIINTVFFLTILVLDLSIGLITFFIATKYIQSRSTAFIRIENSIVSAQQTLNRYFGFVIKESLELVNVEMTTIREYSNFAIVLSGLVYIPFMNSMIQSSKSRLLDPYYKKLFSENAKEFENPIESTIIKFNTINTQNLPQTTLQYANRVISEYKQKHPNFSQ